MKRIIFSTLVFLLFGLSSFAQCDKKVSYTVSRVEFLNDDGKVEHAEEGRVVVEVSKNEVIINHNDLQEDRLKGTIEQATCEWKEAFKNGKSLINVELKEANGERRDSTLTIEGKYGKITILLNMQGKRIAHAVNKYEEKS